MKISALPLLTANGFLYWTVIFSARLPPLADMLPLSSAGISCLHHNVAQNTHFCVRVQLN